MPNINEFWCEIFGHHFRKIGYTTEDGLIFDIATYRCIKCRKRKEFFGCEMVEHTWFKGDYYE